MAQGGDKDRVPGEFSLIEELFAPLAGPEGLGLTDDAAVLSPRAGYDLVFTKDAIAEGRHYLPDDPPETVAKKLLRVNLSDLAAKGATPRGYLLSCGWSEETTYEWMQAFAKGLEEDQEEFGLQLWGGDTIKVEGSAVFSLTAVGEVATGKMITRSGAAPGDDLWVTGTIGDAALGLKVAQGSHDALSGADRDYLIGRYRVPEPPVAFGRQLRGLASAAIDISDGLLGDLEHLCTASQVGGQINLASLPLSEPFNRCVEAEDEVLQFALGGGDDYQILFSVPGTLSSEIEEAAQLANVQVMRIGEITNDIDASVLLKRGSETLGSIDIEGYQHF